MGIEDLLQRKQTLQIIELTIDLSLNVLILEPSMMHAVGMSARFDD